MASLPLLLRYDMRATNLFSFLLNIHAIEQILVEPMSSDFHLGVSKVMEALHIVLQNFGQRD